MAQPEKGMVAVAEVVNTPRWRSGALELPASVGTTIIALKDYNVPVIAATEVCMSTGRGRTCISEANQFTNSPTD